jgi:hypothetical protein
MLLLACSDNSHHRCHKPGTLRAVGPKAALAPAHAWPNGPLRRIIGRFHPGLPHQRPPRLAPLADVPTRPFRLGDATGVARFEPSLDLPSDRPHVVGETRVRQRAVAHPMPLVEHLAGLPPQRLPISRERPPRSIIASMSRSRWAQQSCRRQGGYQRYPLPRSVTNHPHKRSPRSSWATLPLRDSRTAKTVTPVVTTVHSQARCCPSRHPVSSAYAAGWART